MSKEIIYYTDNRMEEPIFSTVQKQILKANLPIVSTSLRPIDFGKNIVLKMEPGIITYITQIKTALENSTADYVFFTEHDVLYSPSHFEFTPPRDDIFYYNTNVWRWDYPKDRLIAYDGLRSLSGLCCNRKLALANYKKRLKTIYEGRLYNEPGNEPKWARVMGYEPGTKTIRKGGVSDECFEEWRSQYPNIDIRHGKTISRSKCNLADFKHKPINWKETTLNMIEGWNFKNLWN